MNKNQKILIGIAVIVIIAFLVGWRLYQNSRQGNVIKIGALLSLSGDAAAWGENAQKAIKLAVDEINKKGGINGKLVDMIYEDTAGDPKQAVSAYQKVTTIDRVAAVIGPLNQTEDAAVVPLIDQTGVPTIVPGYLPLQNRKNLYNPLIIWMDAEIEAGRIAQYVYDQGIRNVGVAGTLDSWENTVSTAFAQKFQTLGGTVISQEIIQPDVADMRLPVTKIVATRPQAVFLGTYYQFVNSAKALHDLGYKGKLYGIEVDDYLAGQTSGWTNGLRFIAPDYYTSDFIKTFTDKYGVAPGLPAGQSYDAANILFSFLKKSQSQNDILDQMKSFKEYDGVSGKLQIGSDGRTFIPTALFELQDGKVTRVSTLP